MPHEHEVNALYSALMGLTVYREDVQRRILDDLAQRAREGNRHDLATLAYVMAAHLGLTKGGE